MRVINQPYQLLFVAALVLAVFSFFVYNQTLDLQFHDTYFVIPLKQLYWALSILLALYGLLYRWTSKIIFSSFLSWAHVTATLLLVLFIVTAPAWMRLLDRGLSSDPFTAAEQRWRNNRSISIIFLVLLASQLLYVINVAVELVRRLR